MNHVQPYFQKFYLTNPLYLTEFKKDYPWEFQLTNLKNVFTCEQVKIKIMKPTLKTDWLLDDSEEWIIILPSGEKLKLNYQLQAEVRELMGTFSFRIPTGCQISTFYETVTNTKTVSFGHPMLLPELEMIINSSSAANLTLQLDKIELETLQHLRTQIVNNVLILSN